MAFDTKLMFHEHVRRITEHAICATQGLAILGNSLQGLSPSHCRLLYTQCIRPIVDYASLACYVGSASMIKPLINTQKMAIRRICSAYVGGDKEKHMETR